MTVNKKIRRRNRTRIAIAVLITIVLILTAALTATLFVVDKLNKNNLFIKSVLVDNNYFLSLNDDRGNEGENAEYPADVSDRAYAVESLMEAVGKIDALRTPLGYLTLDYATGNVTYDYNKINTEQFLTDTVEYEYPFVSEAGDDSWEYTASPLDGAISALSGFFSYAADIYDRLPKEDFIAEMKSDFLFMLGTELPDFNPVRQRSVCIDVPYISQEGRLPNGCESVSATMLLQYCGFDIEPETFVDEYLDCEPVTIKWGCRYGPNPKLHYAGDPYSKNDGYGCFSPVIVRALNKYLSGTDYSAKNVSGLSLNMLKTQYIDRGIPVAVWVTVGMEEIDRIVLWQSTDGGESFMYPANEHCMVFVGYDEAEDVYIFADPYGSNGVVRYGVDESVLAYNSLNMQAVAIMKRGGK